MQDLAKAEVKAERENQVNAIDKKLEQLTHALESLEATAERMKAGGPQEKASESQPKQVPTFQNLWSGMPGTIQVVIERIETANEQIVQMIF